MKIRPGNNPKRRIVQPEILATAQNNELIRRVRYVGSGHHKRNPADYGFTRTNPRPTKSLCDLNRTITQAEAQHLLEQGIEQCLISEPGLDGYSCTTGTDSLSPQLGNLITPWQMGVNAASELRNREKLGSAPVSDTRLAELFGITPNALTQPQHNSKELGFSFFIAAEKQSHRVVLRSKWRTGCRFELARLLGDRIISASADSVLPATRAYTYRQKIQRAFSAELLSPLNEVLGVLNEDYTEEARQEAADYFGVSEWTIRTQLANSGHILREDIEWTNPATAGNQMVDTQQGKA